MLVMAPLFTTVVPRMKTVAPLTAMVIVGLIVRLGIKPTTL